MVFHSFNEDISKKHQWVDTARVQKEIGCAFAASFLVSPLVSIIDKAIVQEVSGLGQLFSSMGSACKEMVLKPRVFLTGLPFRLTFAVYFGTYATANLSEAALDHYKIGQDETRKGYKVGASAAANVSLLAWRDSVFARVYASPSGAAPARTPIRTIGLFGIRDTVTMAATFYVAPKVADHLVKNRKWDKDQADLTASLSMPVIAQFLTAPFHIHAIDYFNRPTATTGDRFLRIKEELGKVSLARGMRILPAFGIGSFSNSKFRELFIKELGDTEMPISRAIRRRASYYPEMQNENRLLAHSPANNSFDTRRRESEVRDA